MNISIIVVLSTQFFLALIGAAMGYSWVNEYLCLSSNEECDGIWSPYLPKTDYIGIGRYFTNIGTWILIMTNMVPISLMVSLEVVKYT